MQFKRNTTTISVGENTKPLFEKLESIRPKHLSFSLFLAVVVDDYLKSHKTNDAKITEFTDEYEAFEPELRVEALMLPEDSTAIIRIDKTIAIDDTSLFNCKDDNGNWVGS